MCSTPFGITDYIGRGGGAVGPRPRHVCSTPFGITDYIGPTDAGDLSASAGGAQRLSASRIISGAGMSNVSNRTVLCSTPFGITDYIGCERAHHAAVVLCSTPFGITDYIGREGEGAGDAAAHVLNAFRHHGLYRIANSRAGPSVRIMCSTPFGITDYIGVRQDQ